MSGGRRALAALLAPAIVALTTAACGERTSSEPCTRADLQRPVAAAMPAPVAITRTRRFNRERLDPLPASVTPPVTAGEAWRRLRDARQSTGGGRDELLLGVFSGGRYSRVPAWVLFTSHAAERLEPLALPPGVTARADADVCVFVDVLTVLDADTGERFYGSTTTSTGPAGQQPPTRTRRPEAPPPDATGAT